MRDSIIAMAIAPTPRRNITPREAAIACIARCRQPEYLPAPVHNAGTGRGALAKAAGARARGMVALRAGSNLDR